ncbi:DUF1934 domain-containing protein [Butyrivibrio sp. X503]|uniref:DUF1934 domain-containing protein n=1 Tax=Butyrivibrio sp. X503 TaxID=2364878 RepID=UPI0013140D25|nr:DUF1934 domain-containing protein [Butyrivibrio sp. X503]
MKKKVEVNVTGIHNRQGEPEEKINTVSEGVYEVTSDGTGIIEYKEVQEADGHRFVFHNKAIISPDKKMLEVQRGGSMSTGLVFSEGKDHETEYNTPYGKMFMNVITKSLAFEEGDVGEIKAVAEYAIKMGDEIVSDSVITIETKKRK